MVELDPTKHQMKNDKRDASSGSKLECLGIRIFFISFKPVSNNSMKKFSKGIEPINVYREQIG